MQDNNDTLTVKSTLTKIGKKRSAEGNLHISKVAFADDGINYSLIKDNLSDDSILLKRTPLFDVWGDSPAVLKNKILVDKSAPQVPNNREFGVSMSRIGDQPEIQVKSVGTVKFPTETKENGFKTFKYYGTDNKELSRQVDVVFDFAYSEIFNTDNLNYLTRGYEESQEPKYLTVTLFDNRYFDIALTPDNIAKYSRLPNPNILFRYKNSKEIKKMLEDTWNNVAYRLMNGDEPVEGVVDKHILSRNWVESMFLNFSNQESTPKTINVLNTYDNTGNSFFLRYRGKYNYRNAQKAKYETVLSIFDEITGQTEYIKLAIIPELKP